MTPLYAEYLGTPNFYSTTFLDAGISPAAQSSHLTYLLKLPLHVIDSNVSVYQWRRRWTLKVTWVRGSPNHVLATWQMIDILGDEVLASAHNACFSFFEKLNPENARFYMAVVAFTSTSLLWRAGNR
jgi:hypothetical protein